ncbi:MAG TPA: AI-2E family transporter, partial [Roseiflexaceae bacterium]|nr:AI-2E family transporter [Roseiflexaceae bacterium]
MKRLFQITLIIGMTLIGLLLLWQFRPTLILFVASLTLTAVLRPIVARLEARGLQRSVAILVLYLGMIVVLLAVAATIVLHLQATLDSSMARVSEGYDNTVERLLAGSPFQQRLSRAVPDPGKWVGLLFGTGED